MQYGANKKRRDFQKHIDTRKIDSVRPCTGRRQNRREIESCVPCRQTALHVNIHSKNLQHILDRREAQ